LNDLAQPDTNCNTHNTGLVVAETHLVDASLGLFSTGERDETLRNL